MELSRFLKMSSFEKEIPKERFSAIWYPIINVVMLLVFILKFYQFGHDSYEFSLVNGLIGVFLFGIVTFLFSYCSGSRSLGSYSRFLILYIAFVPHLKFNYFRRLLDLSYTFGIRDHSFSEKWKGGIALLLSDVSEYLRILLPMTILMLGAAIYDKFPKMYKILITCIVILIILIYVFEGTVNLCKYGIAVILVTMLSDCWNKMRVEKERTQQALVLWAEILLYAAMFAKGLTLIVA